ncbi:hypothetical protein EMPS_01940 [Entomortierella parvispora]|uniref:Major facilitator superfamily (MFS) profile domain-containing protein n=1 Tax=Entomortierella parvispora TaxID=205924 RepID=A0A9P3LT33_9FUNG|nr:hypothetical protein EMPS_01940 [Entomortierella parvispora]
MADNNLPKIITTDATPGATPAATADTPDTVFFQSRQEPAVDTTRSEDEKSSDPYYTQDKNHASRDSMDSFDEEDRECLQPHQRRAVDSHDTGHQQDELAASSLRLAFSDPMLAITQLPNADRRSSIASSIHSNMTSNSSAMRRHLARLSYEKEKAEVDSIHGGAVMNNNSNADDGNHYSHSNNNNSAVAVGSAVVEDPLNPDASMPPFSMPDDMVNNDSFEDPNTPPMDKSWYGYVIVVCSFLIYAIVFGTEHTFGVYQEYYSSPSAEDWLRHAAPQQVAMIGTLATTFTYLLGVFSGRFADIAGYRASTMLGAVFMGVGLIGASFAKSLSVLYICQGVLLGIGSSLVYLPAISCPAHWFERYRSIVIGVVVCGSGFGGLVLGPLTEFLITKVGIHWTLRIQGILCLVGIGGSGMMLKTRVKQVKGQKKKIPLDLTICKETPFVTLAIANFLTSLGYMIPFFFLSTFAVFRNQSASTGAILIGILNGASLVGRLSLGFITDRVGRINMLFCCALVSGLSILCIWSVATSIQVLTVFAIVYGFTCGGYYSVIPSVIADIYGLDRLTTVTGLLYGSIGLGYLIGSPVSGVLLDITEPNTNYIYVVIFSGSSMTLSSFAVFYLKYWRSKGRWWIHG